MENFEQNNDNKQRYIEIDGQMVPVTEEVYLAFKRPAWAEMKRRQRAWRCNVGGHRCTGNCSHCDQAATGAPVSIERMLDDGLDIPQQGDSLEDMVMMNIAIEELHKALAQLAPDDRSIIELFGEGLSDRKISAQTGIPQTTVSYRRKILLKALREQLKDFR